MSESRLGFVKGRFPCYRRAKEMTGLEVMIQAERAKQGAQRVASQRPARGK